MDVSPATRLHEEYQERAFVAASRRKDRSLDARLESANRASMLHMKRTGKALYITREIVEKEAMYEELDERYRQKRMKLLKDQTDQIEAQFQHQLLTAFAAGANSTQQTARVSPDGGIQKSRVDTLSARAYLPNHHHQLMEPVSAGLVLSPTAPSHTPLEMYVLSPGSSCIQTPGAYSSIIPQQHIQGYLTPSLSPTWTLPAAAAQFQSIMAWRQQPFQWSPLALQQPTWQGHPSQPVASAPDTLLLQAWPTPGLSPCPTTSNSSQMSWGDNPLTPIVQDDGDIKQPVIVSTEELDLEYDDFTRFTFGLESQPQWQTVLAESTIL